MKFMLDLVGVGERIRISRKNKRVNLERLAKKLNCSIGLLSSYENGVNNNLSLLHISKIAENLEVSFQWLCFGDENEEELHIKLDKDIRSALDDYWYILDIYHKKFILQAFEMAKEESIQEQHAFRRKQKRAINSI